MFPVLVPTTRPTTREALDAMVEKLDSVSRDVRNKAFESFLSRGERFGSDWEDWFAAERELFRLPVSEMKETPTAFEIRAAVPGFTAENLHVQVLPELIVVEGRVDTKDGTKANAQEKSDGNVVFSEFATKRLFRQYRMSSPIEVKDVQATLDKGILKIAARKQQVPPKAEAVTEVPIRTEMVKAPPTALAKTAGSK